MKRTNYLIAAVLIVIIIGAVFAGAYFLNHSIQASISPTKVLQVVAAENFWGSLITQLGGTHIQVFTIVTDPNADPHEYESTTKDAIAVATANYVIINGAGYDDWAQKLISANNNPNQKVLNVANILGQKVGSNPHFWYNPTFVNEAVHQMFLDLVSLNQSDISYFSQQYATLNASLGGYNHQINLIKQQFAGTEVAATESIAVYLAESTSLNLVSPSTFMEAVSEGNDPPAQSIVQFQQQLQSGAVKVLIFNSQTVTPITQEMESIATKNNLTLVAITETVSPPNTPFQQWMSAELVILQTALVTSASG